MMHSPWIRRLFIALVLTLLCVGNAMAQNAIVVENALPGSPPSEWDISGAGDASIQGFATEISVDQGQTVQFKVRTDATSYRVDIYRLGYYAGDGARKVATVVPSASLPQIQPSCVFDAATGLLDCGNWDVSVSWSVPVDATSGIYLAKLVRTDPEDGRASHVAFIVRDDDGGSEVLFQTSDTTWQAYNRWGEGALTGGYSVYEGPTGKADKLSYNRPFSTRSYPTEDWLFNAEYPMVRWLERNGYDVSYFTNIDTDRLGPEILEHGIFLSVGHDEYWSRAMRDNVTLARDAGVHLAFFSGNEVYWKIRWEDSIDGNGTPMRTMVCYKEGALGESQCGTKCDPVADVWTGLWRSGCDYSPPADGCEPENALTGQISWMGTTGAITVPGAYASLPLWRNTSIAALGPGDTATLPSGTLGYEWDFEQYEEFYPAGRIRMSETNRDGQTHHLSLYQHASGALVFGAGTVQWSWGLDATHDRSGGAEDARMQQATVNLLGDMGVQPETLQAGLVPAVPLADLDPPVSVITFPSDGAFLETGTPTTILGTAADIGVAGVALVEISTDGGANWQAASGLDNWSFTWTPASTGAFTIQSRAMDAAFNYETPSAGIAVTVDPRVCPCTIWSDATVPGTIDGGDVMAVELGMRFQTDEDGYITAVRFYKAATNTGTHVGNVWANDGTLLGSATFGSESASGWQEEPLNPPVPVTANTTYVVSYYAPNGHYSADAGFFAGAGLDNPPLYALYDGQDGSNGVYQYGPASAFPTSTWNSANYWVDARFHTSAVDDQPPYVSFHSPAVGALGVPVESNVSAIFNEPVDELSISFELRDAGNNLVPATLSYDAPTRTATLDPAVDLDHSSLYTAQMLAADDLAGNGMVAPEIWSFTVEDVPAPPPDEGPGGPILVIGEAGNPFTRYTAEILRTEGFNAFTVTDISLVDASVLNAHDVVILGEMVLSAPQVTLISDWVTAGGNLIALRPDPQLAGLLGLTVAGGTLSEAYLQVDTATGPGVGIVGETIQYHGSADLYTLSGATALATLYSDATTATTNPAVTLVDVGGSGGQAAAFSYDLARSVVYTRQGNPAWDGQERDGTAPIRSNDLFYGDAAGDPQPDWIDLDKVAIPQADEQQRLLANLILEMNADKKPLPRFWYFPRGLRAVVIMTGDEHGSGLNSVGRFDIYLGSDPPGCSVANWECVRASTYIYPGTGMTDAQAVYYHSLGFEMGLHVNTGCNDWTQASLESMYTTQLGSFFGQLPSMPMPDSERTHCIAWSEWVGQAKVKILNGIRLDVNYYFWPPGWVQDRPGMFTGSGMPMRFADLDGTMIDVYQAATQMTDESGQSFPFTINTLLDRALGPEGYYGAFTANMHNDGVTHASASAIVASAQARGVPVVSGRQMLTWLDARNASSFANMNWVGNTLSFDVAASASALDLEGMLPVNVGAATLQSITGSLGSVWSRTETIKGIEYAIFPAETGSYDAFYDIDLTPPVITNVNAIAVGDGTALVTWDTDEAADSRVDYGTDPGALNSSVSDAALVTGHSLEITGLAPDTTVHYRVTSADAGALSSTEPDPGSAPLSFITPTGPCLVDTSVADFAAGTPDAGIHIAGVFDGELILGPTEVAEFDGSAVPTGWYDGLWNPAGSSVVAGGVVTLDAAFTGSDLIYDPGHAVEFVGTFLPARLQHGGFGITYNEVGWAMFSTGSSGGTLYARVHNGTASSDVDLGASYLGSPHLYRVEWDAIEVRFLIDGTLVQTTPIAVSLQMRPLMSDFDLGGDSFVVDWVRMTPYAAAGSFLSRVYDAGSTANWGAIYWNSDLPVGTSLGVAVRLGDTPSPDASWSSFASIASSGDTVGGNSRFFQYRVDLATSDVGLTPTLEDMAVDCVPGPDVDPPVILNLTATPSPEGTSAIISWDTSELADSRVDYGTDPGLLDQSVSELVLVLSHSLELLGLSPGQSYHYRATSFDGAGNGVTEPILLDPPLSFTTPAPPCAVVTTSAEFAAGSFDAGITIVEIGDGAISLSPQEGSDFPGTTLPAGWQDDPWSAGGAGVVGGGVLQVNGSLVGPGALYGAGRVVEFEATIGAERYQHLGFAVDFATVLSWAMFSTNNQTSDLYARTAPGGADVNLGAGYLGSPHLYRIEWNASEVLFYIDGALVHTQNITIGESMRPVVSDLDPGNATVIEVDWLRMTPYAGNGSWESEIFDAGSPNSTWRELSWTDQLPVGTSLVLSARGGDTATPDGTWTGYLPVASSGDDLLLDAQYLQVRAELSTSDVTQTPLLEDFSVTCTSCLDSTPPDALADLATVQVLAGNPPGELTQITVSWSGAELGSTVEVYRKPFGDYPDYDDGPTPGVEPTPPLDPAAAMLEGWVLAYAGVDLEFTELPPTRDFWYYVAFLTDACDNVSPVSNMSTGALSYHLGDVSDGITAGAGNNLVDALDISYLGAHYGTSRGGAFFEPVLDVGPTVSIRVDSRPTTDGVLNFEDLILFAINYEVVSKQEFAQSAPAPAVRNSLTWMVPTRALLEGENVEVVLHMQGDGSLHGLSAELEWDRSVLALQAASPSELLAQQGGGSILLQPRDGVIDLALLGVRDRGISGEGVVARLSFRVLKAGSPGFVAGPVQARDPENHELELEAQLSSEQTPGISRPMITALHPNYPNPFNPRTQIAFDLAQPGPVTLKIYAVNGRLVKTLVDEMRPAGRFTEIWDGVDASGRQVASGAYLVHLQAVDASQTRRMVLTK